MIYNYDDLARLEYGRMLWRNPRLRACLLSHWLDPRHPYRERLLEHRDLIIKALESTEDQDEALDQELRS